MPERIRDIIKFYFHGLVAFPALLISLVITFNFSFHASGQHIHLQGKVMKDSSGNPVPHAVIMAVRLSDSILIKYSRSWPDGHFILGPLPVDTYQVVLSHPEFGDRTFIIMCSPSDSVINMHTVIMSEKTQMLQEVTIVGFASPVYFKGDTLIYSADSFKVKPNAVVEDLLKKLPGIRVDKNGKIFAQGQEVDKVLVDGDEFFGNDPTVATKNLPASSVESVQVYDKKNENTSDESKETEKIMDLKLKEDAKKGYFGKVSAAGGGPGERFEEQVLLNKFNGKQKISAFSFGSNTSNSEMDFEDLWEYGLEGEMDYFQYNEEENTYIRDYNPFQGKPIVFKNGVYFNDQLFKDTKVSMNYTYGSMENALTKETSLEYLFGDTTYQSLRVSDEHSLQKSNTANIMVIQKIDSLTSLTLTSKFKYNEGSVNMNETNSFIDEDGEFRRETRTAIKNDIYQYDTRNTLRINRDFRKKNRELTVNYKFNEKGNKTHGYLGIYELYNPSQVTSSVDQEKKSNTFTQEHVFDITYIEPITEKIKTEISIDYNSLRNTISKNVLDFSNGSFSNFNDSLSSGFRNERNTVRAGWKIIRETRKHMIYVGVKARQITSESSNMETLQKYSQSVNSLLPYAKYRYNFSDNSRFSAGYNTYSRQPEINQLQPLNDNTDPNSIYTGNPDLLPSYSHHIRAEYNAFKPVSGNSLWSTAKFTTVKNEIRTSVYYDSLGRSVSMPVNVNGNYSGQINLYYNFSVLPQILSLGPSFYSMIGHSTNLINGLENITENRTWNGGLYATIKADSGKFEINLDCNYSTTYSQASINNNSVKNFYNVNYSATVAYDPNSRWSIGSDISYNYESKAAGPALPPYYIWGASLERKFFKNENLSVALIGYDLLNQSIEVDQSANNNIVSYTKTNIVGRYILLRAIIKFNSNKGKESEE